MDEKLLKAIGIRFPVMNVIPSLGKTGNANTTVIREIKGYTVTLELGISNAYIVGIEKIEEDSDGK